MLRSSLLTVLALGCCALPFARAGFRPTGLTVDYRYGPGVIVGDTLRLGWAVTGASGTRQTAYRVQVGSDSGFAESPPLYDTGEHPSASSQNVRLSPKLPPGRHLRYRVKVWDDCGAESDWSTAYAFFTVPDWTAPWITTRPHAVSPSRAAMGTWDEDERPLTHAQDSAAAYCHRELALPQTPIAAHVYVTGLGYYVLRVNGERVGEEVMAPVFTDYQRTVSYAAHDVIGLLSAGDNDLDVILGPGGALRPQEMPGTHVARRLSPKHLTRLADSTYLVDFGENLSGAVTLQIPATAPGHRVVVHYNEVLDSAGYLEVGYSRSHTKGRFQEDRYVSDGSAGELAAAFSYYGFRYAQVEHYPGDLGYYDLSTYGNPLIETPHLDALAAGGRKLTRGYAAAPLCSPTRASLQAGVNPACINLTVHIHGYPPAPPTQRFITPRTAQELDANLVTVPEAIAERGYAPAHIGKWHLGGGRAAPQYQGYDLGYGGAWSGLPNTFFYPFFNGNPYPELRADTRDGDYLTDELTERVVRFLHDERDGPFFLQLDFYNPHVPTEAPDSLIAYYEAKAERLGVELPSRVRRHGSAPRRRRRTGRGRATGGGLALRHPRRLHVRQRRPARRVHPGLRQAHAPHHECAPAREKGYPVGGRRARAVDHELARTD